MGDNLYFINAFTTEKFKGNPAAIVLLEERMPETWMQAWAAELQQPITTFVLPGQNSYVLRWFTLVKEIYSCGHGTLGAAHVLWQNKAESSKHPLFFETAAGTLSARQCSDGIQLTFSLREASFVQTTEELQQIVPYPVQQAAWAGDRYILELASEEQVRQAAPDLEVVKKLEASGVILTSLGNGLYDVVSRYFPPNIGIAEDHVTGSSHCALASFWYKRLGKETLKAYQASPRGGELKVVKVGDQVHVTGNATLLFQGTITTEGYL